MLKLVDRKINSVVFGGNEASKKGSNIPYQKDTLLKNNVLTNFKINADNLENAFTIYPVKGLKGNKNSNFYEFLTTGTFPYIAGSLTLMGVFNYANKFFDNFGKSQADKLGRKMALGVLFYGLAKEASKVLVTKPVKWATGVDVNLPYARVIYNEPEYPGDTDIVKNEYHKVFESVEFPRWDLLYNDEKSGKTRNAYYDKIAKKMGLGENLKDSDQEVKPKIKSVVTKTTAVTRLTQYLWAGLGVAIAMQKPWELFLTHTDLHFYRVNEFVSMNKDKSFSYKLLKTAKNLGKNSLGIAKSFWFTLKKSAKEFYSPMEKEEEKKLNKFEKHAGKAFLFTTIAATLLGDILACHVSHKAERVEAANKVIDKSRKYTVS